MYVGSLEGGEPKRVFAAKSVAVFAPPASLLWVEDGVLVAQQFDPSGAVVSGEPIPVAQDVGLDEGVYKGAFAVSATGVLAHRFSHGERRQLTWVDRAGVLLGTIGPPDENALSGSELAPDGRRVAVTRIVQGNQDVHLIDSGRGVFERFTSHPGLDSFPLWSPDGARVVFASSCPDGAAFASSVERRRCMFEKAASHAGDDRPLLPSGESKTPMSWSPHGQWLLYNTRHPKTGLDLWAAPMTGDRKQIPVIDTPFDETAGQFSPDGRWVAYQSNESKPVQIYIRPFPGPGGQRPVTTAGGIQPRWRPDGKELFYVGLDGRLMAVPIAVGADQQLEPGAAVALFRAQLATGAAINSTGTGTGAQYAVASDGQRFLINMSVGEATASPIRVVLNWDAALKK
jgi:dipeptidyl aminopeptidase/acylaminoacyl peptidase